MERDLLPRDPVGDRPDFSAPEHDPRVIIIDAGVLSEPIKPAAAPAAVGRVRSRPQRDPSTPAVTAAEIMQGLAVTPAGQRREARLRIATAMFGVAFARRLPPFDAVAAPAFAVITAAPSRAGRPIQTPEAQIAAIARANGMSVATRKARDLAGCGVDLADPCEV